VEPPANACQKRLSALKGTREFSAGSLSAQDSLSVWPKQPEVSVFPRDATLRFTVVAAVFRPGEPLRAMRIRQSGSVDTCGRDVAARFSTCPWSSFPIPLWRHVFQRVRELTTHVLRGRVGSPAGIAEHAPLARRLGECVADTRARFTPRRLTLASVSADPSFPIPLWRHVFQRVRGPASPSPCGGTFFNVSVVQLPRGLLRSMRSPAPAAR
jgi:hypothetical protein